MIDWKRGYVVWKTERIEEDTKVDRERKVTGAEAVIYTDTWRERQELIERGINAANPP